MARRLENWLKSYMAYTQDLEAPERVHFWVGVSVLAGALRRQVWIEQPKFDWTPNFYIILVGPPGVIGKSTCMGTGLGILEKVKGITFGPESLTWQALGKALQDAQSVLQLGTGENMESIPMSCLTIAASELGTLLKLDDDGLSSMLIAMWDGQRANRPWKHATVSSSQIEIVNPWLNIIGCTTPTWLKANFPDRMIGGGLTSRIMFVYAEKKRRLIAYPSEVWSGDESKKLKDDLVNDLEEIAALKGRYVLTKDAIKWGTEWYEKLWTKRPAHLASGRFDAYISRKQTAMHKISMVLTAARTDELTITKEAMEEADMLLTSNETDMLRVFDSIGIVNEAKHIHEIMQFISVHGRIAVEELWKLCFNLMELKDFRAAIVAGLEAGQISKLSAAKPGSQFDLDLVSRSP